jgi:adenylate cyclase
MTAAPALRIQRFGGESEVYQIAKEAVFIGKNDTVAGILNDITFEDGTVSRRHAKISREGSNWFIEDCQSKNHTYVNDTRIKRKQLMPGDRITIGMNSLVFESGEVTSLDPSVVVVRQKDLDQSKTIDLNYIILTRISEIVHRATSLDEFFQAVLGMVRESIRSRKGLVILSREGDALEVAAAQGPDATYDELSVERVIRKRQSMLSSYATVSGLQGAQAEMRSVLCVPLIKEEKALGVIYLETSQAESFAPNDLLLLTAAANQTTAGIERVALNERIREETLVRGNLERFFSAEVAAKIAKESMETGGLTIQPEKVCASIVFTDIKGFTRLTEALAPAEIARLLRDYFSLMTEVVFRHEGVLDKYIGDAIMAVFGVPVHREDHARRAVAAALEMRDEHARFVRTLEPAMRFQMRIGVNTGEVVAGYMGSVRRMEYTVLGMPVVIAKRLESLAEGDTVYVGHDTYVMSAQYFDYESLPKVRMPKGDGEIEVYKALEVKK